MPAAGWDGQAYQDRFDALGAEGVEVHGEAAFVVGLAPSSVLDAGCGTGRVAIELSRAGIEVVGVDLDASMLAVARHRGPTVTWMQADVTSLRLTRTFDVVLMAGNVPLFTPPGSHAALVSGCALHLGDAGSLVCGFQLGRGYELAEYDAHCGQAGLVLAERWATWDRQPWTPGAGYAVSVHVWESPV